MARVESRVNVLICLTVKHKVHIMLSMNRLPRDRRVEIIKLLVEGMSLRAITRITGASINTVTSLLVTAGKACSDYQDKAFRNLICRRVQIDEIWAFCYAKEKAVATAKAAPNQAGDLWTFVALDSDTKLVPSWMVGSRDTETARVFVDDLAGRIATRIQLTSDGYRPYLVAVMDAFEDVDYAMLVKHYSVPKGEAQAARRYSPAECVGITREPISGNPTEAYISTSHIERQNLTMRMQMRRFTRLTNAFSKKAENHAHAVALHFMHYNFCRIHTSLKCTPAMRAGVVQGLWDVVDIVRVIEDWETARSGKDIN
jgi:IS1 family transposase